MWPTWWWPHALMQPEILILSGPTLFARAPSPNFSAMRGYDLVMTANQWGAPETFEEPQPIFHFLDKASFAMPFNVTGQPALTLCCGFGSDSFPLAFQLVGRPFDEASVFAAGAAFERATPWRLHRPSL